MLLTHTHRQQKLIAGVYALEKKAQKKKKKKRKDFLASEPDPTWSEKDDEMDYGEEEDEYDTDEEEIYQPNYAGGSSPLSNPLVKNVGKGSVLGGIGR